MRKTWLSPEKPWTYAVEQALTVYMAKKGFEATELDISHKAIEYGREKALEAGVKIRWIVGNALRFPFEDGEFDSVFDMSCFHHMLPEHRADFIEGLCRILKSGGQYLLTCFSDGNGSAWNHFTKDQLIQLFSDRFMFQKVAHHSSVEGDGFTRFFFSILMQKKRKPC